MALFSLRLSKFPTVWGALGGPIHYVEPFCGSLAALLLRLALANRSQYFETVNDKDGLLVNALRAIQMHPQETAQAASWPQTEADLVARHVEGALQARAFLQGAIAIILVLWRLWSRRNRTPIR